jgi:hypothetical protein
MKDVHDLLVSLPAQRELVSKLLSEIIGSELRPEHVAMVLQTLLVKAIADIEDATERNIALNALKRDVPVSVDQYRCGVDGRTP